MDDDILIGEDGHISYVYSDRLDAIFADVPRETVRASHVEPYCGGWAADMRPSGGGVLGSNGESTAFGEFGHRYVGVEPLVPFQTRQAALDAERAWLRKELGL